MNNNNIYIYIIEDEIDNIEKKMFIDFEFENNTDNYINEFENNNDTYTKDLIKKASKLYENYININFNLTQLQNQKIESIQNKKRKINETQIITIDAYEIANQLIFIKNKLRIIYYKIKSIDSLDLIDILIEIEHLFKN